MSLSHAAKTALAALAAEVRLDEPLAPWSSVRVGGRAEAMVRPRTRDALVGVLTLAADEGLPVSILGGGANTLVGDGGVPGLTLKLATDLVAERLDRHQAGAVLTLGGGAAIARVIVAMRTAGLVGAEFLAGIPGTIGGAVAMNAGTKHGECMSIVESLELATRDGVGQIEASTLRVRYRHTELPPGAIVIGARFRLRTGDVAASEAAMTSDLSYRKRTQPLSLPNFGSVFTNPPGDHAGRLLEAVNLKGHTVGGAQISNLHANWIVNLGGATARDVTTLMALGQTRVREQFGVELEPEVKRIGVFT